MKPIFPIFLLIPLILLSCTGEPSGHTENDSLANVQKGVKQGPDNGIAIKKKDSTYREQDIYFAYYEANDTTTIGFFNTSINDIQCAMYFKTEISTIDSTAIPPNRDKLVSEFKSKDVVLEINGKQIELEHPINDAPMLKPGYIGLVTSKGIDYLLIRMNLISFMAGDNWYNLLLTINEGKVVAQKQIETDKELTPLVLKSYLNN